jgi:hypothetical protein
MPKALESTGGANVPRFTAVTITAVKKDRLSDIHSQTVLSCPNRPLTDLSVALAKLERTRNIAK